MIRFMKQFIRMALWIFPDFLKVFLYRLFFKTMSERSQDIVRVRYSESPDTGLVLRNLKRSKFRPSLIIDVGGYAGDWTRMAHKIFLEAKFFVVEANPEKKKCLERLVAEFPGTIEYSMALLGAEPRASVTYYQMKTGSSVFEEQSDVERKVITLPMKTLDEVAGPKVLLGPILLKLDVQGSELEVLKGASATLKKTEVVLLEVSFLQYNKNSPLAADVIQFMNDRGFVVYDIGTLARHRQQESLLQADMFFVRPG